MDLLTEEQIELSVERKFNSLDARLMKGSLTQEDYDIEAERVRSWADYQLAKL